MLETVLKLAKLVQNKAVYHLYAHEPYYGSDIGEKFFYRRIFVDKNFKFTFDPEPFQDDRLMDARAIAYKGCPADGSPIKHYLFGDICITRDGNELKGNYNYSLADPTKPDTFDQANTDFFDVESYKKALTAAQGHVLLVVEVRRQLELKGISCSSK